MTEVHVHATIRAPLDVVFAAVSDHARFLAGDGTRCAVTRPGHAERDGLGALRTVDAGAVRFVEEVTRFERPTRFDYVIRTVTLRGLPLPIRHELGWLELTEEPGGTRVDWRTRYTVAVPGLGGPLARRLGRRLAAAFTATLARTRRQLEG